MKATVLELVRVLGTPDVELPQVIRSIEIYTLNCYNNHIPLNWDMIYSFLTSLKV
jgi:hypothetical protein